MKNIKNGYKLEDVLLGAQSVASESKNVRINHDKAEELRGIPEFRFGEDTYSTASIK